MVLDKLMQENTFFMAMARSPRLTSVSLIALAACAFAHSAYAQVPSTAEPGRQDQRFRVIDERPDVSQAPVVEDGSGASKPLKGDVNFTLKSVKIEGNSVFSDSELEQFYGSYIGQKVSLNTLNKIANDITAHYRNNTYILSRAVLPPQRIEGGSVIIRIVEGRVDNVRLEGDVGSNGGVLQGYADKIRASQPLSSNMLERYLLLMEDLPGVTARAVLQPAAGASGASDVVINISRKTVEGSLSADNRGSRFLGPYQLSGTVSGNNLLGFEDQTQFTYVNSIDFDELHFAELRHEEPIGSEGTRAAISASFAKTQPGSTVEALDIEGISRSATIGVTHPFIRSRQTNLFGNAEFTWKSVDVSILDTALYEDNLRVLRVGGTYDTLDRWLGINRVDLNLSKGFDWDAESEVGAYSRTSGDPSFEKVTLEVTRLQPITNTWAVYAGVSGQYATGPLLASEEFAIGGANYGSAYDAAEITGDHGVAFRAELQRETDLGLTWLPRSQFYGFYDVGRVWNRDITPGAEADHISLASTGLGTRFNLLEDVSGGLEVALPLTKKVSAYGEDGSAPRAFFNVNYRF